MPSQIVVVERSDRYAFAAPRSAPAWLHALWTAVLHATPPITNPDRSIVASRVAPRIPRLRLGREPGDGHRCAGCESCVALCPSRSLSLDRKSRDEDFGLARFELDLGSCIGCGLCAKACPESAIEMTLAPRALAAPGAGRPLRIDLLALEV